jgi:hypothetical protein
MLSIKITAVIFAANLLAFALKYLSRMLPKLWTPFNNSFDLRRPSTLTSVWSWTTRCSGAEPKFFWKPAQRLRQSPLFVWSTEKQKRTFDCQRTLNLHVWATTMSMIFVGTLSKLEKKLNF